MNARKVLLALALAALCGCYRMTVRNGQPAGTAPIFDTMWNRGTHRIAWTG